MTQSNDNRIVANVVSGSMPIHSIVQSKDKPIQSTLQIGPSATTEHKGIIRIATDEEALEGLDNTIAITPFTLKDFVENNALPIYTTYGKRIEASVDEETYVLTVSLKDQNGDVLNTVSIELGDLIDGLQEEITSENPLNADLVDDAASTHKFVTSAEKTQITTNANNILNLSTTVTNNYNTLDSRITNEVTTLNTTVGTETTNRRNADNNLQSQIDAIVSSSDVFDIVGTYAELQAYDITTVPVNDIVKVLVDSTHSNAATYYRCIETDDIKSWSYIGSEGAYYTKSESDSLFVEQTTTINGKALSSNITLSASDVSALPSSTQIGNGTIVLTQGGIQKGTFTLNQTGNVTIDFDAGGSIITVDTALSTSSTNPVQNKVITTELNKKLESITSSDVTSALGYTPYNSTNPNGYITSSAISSMQTTTNLVTSVSSASTDAQYPSAKLFYDTVGNIESALNTINSGSNS